MTGKTYLNLLLPYLTMASLSFKEDILNCLQFGITPENVKAMKKGDVKRLQDVLKKVISIDKKQ